MKTPESLVPAIDCGIIQEVVRPLMSGKEAQIYVVVAGGIECAAKVYKEASQRTFKHRAEYTEGRRTRNSRDQRAVQKRTRHGRKQDEASWRDTEISMIYRLRDAGVRVPEPMNSIDNVLVMELVKDADGDPAPRLGDMNFSAPEARTIYRQLLSEVVRMLCAGVIHGDLSEFNVLMSADGPVVIDFPQSLNAASNQNARKFLLRDVENLHRFVERYAPRERSRPYGEEMWSLYEANRLQPDTELRGDYRAPRTKANTEEVLSLIDDAERERQARRVARGEEPTEEAPRPRRTVVDFTKEAKPRSGKAKRAAKPRGARPDSGRTRPPANRPGLDTSGKDAPKTVDGAPKKRRGRRRRKSSTAGASEANAENASRPARSRPAAKTKAGVATASKSAAPSRAEGPAKRRRRRRTGAPSESRERKPADESSSKSPKRSEPDPRQRAGPSGAGNEAKRPVRRRRRRPQRSGVREPT